MSDLISRQSAIAAIRKDIMGGLNYESILRDMPSVQQWILCNESLPAVGVDVLVCYKLGKIRYVSIGELLGDGEFHGCDDEYLTEEGRKRKAFAWMPLPEPYKGEGNG